jgi:hypothetical protein
MARGWESKSIEAQIDMAESRHSSVKPFQKAINPQQLEVVRKRETLLLSRTRVMRELDSTQNPRYKGILSKALADLDAQLARCASA